MCSSSDRVATKLDLDLAKLGWMRENQKMTRRIIEMLTDEVVMAEQLHSTLDRSHDRPDCGYRVRRCPTLDEQDRSMR
jgi:hypothetical protein